MCWNIIKVFDAFAGIGGFRSGLEKVGGYQFVGWCEIDKFAQKAYRVLYDTGGETFFENIRTIDTRELPDFDLLTGGFPCQSFSAAGLRKGFNDERGTLFFELARILKDRQPRYFLFENVPNLLGIDKGQTFAKILTLMPMHRSQQSANYFENHPDKITEFDENAFNCIVEKMIVHTENELEFHLIGGFHFKESI